MDLTTQHFFLYPHGFASSFFSSSLPPEPLLSDVSPALSPRLFDPDPLSVPDAGASLALLTKLFDAL